MIRALTWSQTKRQTIHHSWQYFRKQFFVYKRALCNRTTCHHDFLHRIVRLVNVNKPTLSSTFTISALQVWLTDTNLRFKALSTDNRQNFFSVCLKPFGVKVLTFGTKANNGLEPLQTALQIHVSFTKKRLKFGFFNCKEQHLFLSIHVYTLNFNSINLTRIILMNLSCRSVRVHVFLQNLL